MLPFLVLNSEGGSRQIDDTWYFPHETTRPRMVVNDLVVRDLQRSNLGQNLVCKATNNNLTQPAVASIIIDMTCKSISQFYHD